MSSQCGGILHYYLQNPALAIIVRFSKKFCIFQKSSFRVGRRHGLKKGESIYIKAQVSCYRTQKNMTSYPLFCLRVLDNNITINQSVAFLMKQFQALVKWLYSWKDSGTHKACDPVESFILYQYLKVFEATF